MLRYTKYVDPATRKLREAFDIDVPRQGLLEWLSRPAGALAGWIDVLLIEKRKWQKLPWRQRLRAWRHGFSSHSWILYELADRDPADYLSDRTAIRLADRPNGRYNEPIFSKVMFARLLQALGAPQPAVLGYLGRGRFYPETGPAVGFLEGIDGLLARQKDLVCRPSFGGGGTGILFIDRRGAVTRVNGREADPATLQTLLGGLDDYLVTERVEQAPYAREIFPDTTNTLRILTLWDFEQDRPFMAAACHRFGREGFGPLDNFHAGRGGTSVPIDREDGRMGRAAVREGNEIRRLAHHPDSGAAIEGVRVPDWEKTKAEILELAAQIPYAPCVGWDLVKTRSGWVCLEGNPTPGYHVWQVHGPLLSDERARQFYRRVGMLK